MNSEINNDFASFELKEGILHITFKKAKTLDLQGAKQIVRDRIRIQNGKTYPILCDIGEVLVIDKAAKDYFIRQGAHLITALAVLTKDRLVYHIFRYFISQLQSEIPAGAFRDQREAMAFLREEGRPKDNAR